MGRPAPIAYIRYMHLNIHIYLFFSYTLCPLFALLSRRLPRLGSFGFAPVGLALLLPWSGAALVRGLIAFARGGLVRALFVPVPSLLGFGRLGRLAPRGRGSLPRLWRSLGGWGSDPSAGAVLGSLT